MTRPSVARVGHVGQHRPDPHAITWAPADLARRRALSTARQELLDADARGDHLAIVKAWRSLVALMERAEAGR